MRWWPTGTPVEVSRLSAPVQAVSGGFVHTCALLDDDRVFCWGLGTNGQLGDGRSQSSLSPVEVAFTFP